MTGTVSQYVANIDNLPVLPEIAQKVIALADAPRPNIAELADLIQKDLSITANIFKLINSGYFSLRREIADVRQAVVLLGLQQVRNLVVTMVSVNHFEEPPGSPLKLANFWDHCLGVATITQSLAQRFKFGEAPNLYLAALLHDVGKIIIQCHYPDDLSQIVDYMEQNHCAMVQAEQAILGFTHAEIGGVLAEKWQLPSSVCEAITYHHQCQKANDHVFAAILQFADFITKGRLQAVYGDQFTDVVFDDEPCWKILKQRFAAQNIDFERLLLEMDDEIDKARELVRQARGS
ncbi:HDOD domain-containing protein [Acanthopleuribacter pedis]|uniref:HDOD domain-containing protein n=1 Tax=Acanthopleuribacter pedis TaxID=442870 RepID=A0A8J7U3J7_9BACT|nr:HDOD domain-containing protein [Acanthopleuribacter pedis]MBO1318824.1 HDOD domain-containing protein [Acanthopleuribacter pedis]